MRAITENLIVTLISALLAMLVEIIQVKLLPLDLLHLGPLEVSHGTIENIEFVFVAMSIMIVPLSYFLVNRRYLCNIATPRRYYYLTALTVALTVAFWALSIVPLLYFQVAIGGHL